MNNNKQLHPVHKVYDGTFTTASGIKIDICNPTPDMITISDIAKSLSKICRFGGHTNIFYSVAQHSCLVASLITEPLMMEGLLHDASEAYLGDVIKPLKVLLGEAYSSLEVKFEKAIEARFKLYNGEEVKALVKKADMQALELEHSAFVKGNRNPLINTINKYRLFQDFAHAWDPLEAEQRLFVNFGLIVKTR